jgi:3-oxoacyl-[acyl-carrier-protein] synthase-3
MLHIDPTVAILGTGSALPERRVTNAELAGMVTNYDTEKSGDFAVWVDRVTHIQERRFIDPHTEGPGVLGLRAARKALEAADMPAEKIEHVIFASFTYHDMFPGEHTWIVKELGINCGTFALAAACAGSLFALNLARALVVSGQYENVMVIGAETLSRVLDFSDPVTAILFADSAGAAIVGRKDDGENTGLVGKSILHSSYKENAICMWNANVPLPEEIGPDGIRKQTRAFLRMIGGPRVLRNAVNKMAESVCQVFGFELQDLKDNNPELRAILDQVRLIPHQANGRIVDGLGKTLGVPSENVYRTIYFAGNSSSGTNLVTLDYAVREGNLWRTPPEDGSGEMGTIAPCGRTLQKGDLVVVASIGAGYLYGAMAFRHAY